MYSRKAVISFFTNSNTFSLLGLELAVMYVDLAFEEIKQNIIKVGTRRVSKGK